MHQLSPFLLAGSTGTELTINDDALKKIQQEKRSITVVSIMGTPQTGKSYLLKCLMGKALEQGPVTEAKTKGIWFWMGDFPGQPERCLILLNMTGLSDAQKGDATCDLNLFVLALLASSIFIYNGC
jgi:ribosome biogenesis GTPase A